MNKKLLDRFMTEKVAVHVKTQDEYNKFMKLLGKKTNIRWADGDKPIEYNGFKNTKQNTLIYSNFGACLTYNSVEYYRDSHYEIIEFSDLIAIPKPEKKNSDVPLTQNDKVVAYMKKENGITTLEAFKNLGVTRLSARIHDIRDMGYVVGDEFIKVIDRNGSETRVKMYWLIREPEKREGE
ncbi:MAG: helix-turn-helix domain-containing protein [Lachnospiraceae bacterium]|nr:helix-turn-helix domain-containing protein [Lachnospiraceae bacterium]